MTRAWTIGLATVLVSGGMVSGVWSTGTTHQEVVITFDTVETGKPERIDNMRAFTAAALNLLEQALA